ncbi:MAG: universal stress protein [Pseudomonadota bacterium]
MADRDTDNDRLEQAQADASITRVFLVVVDETDEWRAALRFACRRAEHTGGRVALLHVIEPVDFQHWMSVEEVMRTELREEAEALMDRIAAEVNESTGQLPIIFLREGTVREELLTLIDEEPNLSILVLGASTQSEGPGPLIQYLMTKGVSRLHIPVTVVPGSLADEEIDKLS